MRAAPEEDEGVATITVSGEGRASGPADMLTIAARVAVGRPTVAEAVAVAASAAGRLREALAALGVGETEVSTTGYHLEPEHDPDDHRRVIGYRAEHALAVVVSDLDRAGEMLDAATSSAGDDVRIGGLTFDISDKVALAAAARRIAWEDAVSRARQLADHAGLTLGGAVDIRETVPGPPGPMRTMAFAAMEPSCRLSSPSPGWSPRSPDPMPISWCCPSSPPPPSRSRTGWRRDRSRRHSPLVPPSPGGSARCSSPS
jgi:uncharacterized protein YggE